MIKMASSEWRRSARAKRFKQPDMVEAPSYAEHINALSMVASLVGLLMQVRTAIAVSPGRHVLSLYSCLGRRVLLRGLHDQCWTD